MLWSSAACSHRLGAIILRGLVRQGALTSFAFLLDSPAAKAFIQIVGDGYGAPLGAPAPAGPGLWGWLGPGLIPSQKRQAGGWLKNPALLPSAQALSAQKQCLEEPSRQRTGIPKKETGRAEWLGLAADSASPRS